ncbi:MAG: hypothetical protein COV44_00920 [Deltaproteobacteria bacterium CG11_big_fil_rev_8_21_14_0_20_45_16]|nr:MAG: hypothetical protein COV44_00920 [Deltaproteobacteria bacterium CG11_big_fil_rev_8_21_14_0_20_45_16]
MSVNSKFPVIEMLATGNELLDGSISDKHVQNFGGALRQLGLELSSVTIVPDNFEVLRKQLLTSMLRADVLLVSGGLGPTSDDLTLEVAAPTFGSRMTHSARAEANVLARLKRRGLMQLNASHKKMCLIPEGSEVLSNEEGAAPAVAWQIGDKKIFFLPGPPIEFTHVLQQHVLPYLSSVAPKMREYLFVYKIFGWPESELNELMKKFEIPHDVQVGYRTKIPENHIKLFVKASSREMAAERIAKLEGQIVKAVGSKLFARDAISFEEAMLKKFIDQRMTISLAESCTGGLTTSLITSVPGSSKILDRSFITYSNESKVELLGVKATTLEEFGAVSEEVAREMAQGALEHSRASHAAAITGIAGPDGGTPQKPVGTICFAWATKEGSCRSQRVQLSFDRSMNQLYSAYLALFGFDEDGS